MANIRDNLPQKFMVRSKYQRKICSNKKIYPVSLR